MLGMRFRFPCSGDVGFGSRDDCLGAGTASSAGGRHMADHTCAAGEVDRVLDGGTGAAAGGLDRAL